MVVVKWFHHHITGGFIKSIARMIEKGIDNYCDQGDDIQPVKAFNVFNIPENQYTYEIKRDDEPHPCHQKLNRYQRQLTRYRGDGHPGKIQQYENGDRVPDYFLIEAALIKQLQDENDQYAKQNGFGGHRNSDTQVRVIKIHGKRRQESDDKN
jgi:hypothetical protein